MQLLMQCGFLSYLGLLYLWIDFNMFYFIIILCLLNYHDDWIEELIVLSDVCHEYLLVLFEWKLILYRFLFNIFIFSSFLCWDNVVTCASACLLFLSFLIFKVYNILEIPKDCQNVSLLFIYEPVDFCCVFVT